VALFSLAATPFLVGSAARVLVLETTRTAWLSGSEIAFFAAVMAGVFSSAAALTPHPAPSDAGGKRATPLQGLVAGAALLLALNPLLPLLIFGERLPNGAVPRLPALTDPSMALYLATWAVGAAWAWFGIRSDSAS
jgi:hypothetical protein